MLPARIAELLGPFLGAQALSSSQLRSISTYIDILLRWNARINLTAIREPEEIVTRHFGESLFAASRLFPGDARAGAAGPGRSAGQHSEAVPTLADLGSGAGFPGLPIKLWAPQIHVTLIESNHKKATFLKEITRALTLTNVNIQTARAEAIVHARDDARFDVVTLRAVESFAAVLPTAASLLAPKGRLALLIGSAQLAQAQTALPQMDWSKPIPIPLSRSRILAFANNRLTALESKDARI